MLSAHRFLRTEMERTEMEPLRKRFSDPYCRHTCIIYNVHCIYMYMCMHNKCVLCMYIYMYTHAGIHSSTSTYMLCFDVLSIQENDEPSNRQ